MKYTRWRCLGRTGAVIAAVMTCALAICRQPVFGDETSALEPPPQHAARLFKEEAAWLQPRMDYAALSPDGRIFATPVGKEIWLLHATDGHIVRKLPGWTPGGF